MIEHKLATLAALDIEYGEETTFANYTIKVEQDDMGGESPREWDNLGTMVYWHRNYILGDVDGSKEYGDYSSQSNFWIDLAGIEDEGQELDMDKVMELAYKRNVILPLYLYDHSGITMNTTGFSCPWDSGQVGFIYVSLEDIRKEYNWKNVTKKRRAQIEKYLRGEVETYDQYITGNVWWYSIEREDADGDVVDLDSCGGYYGDERDDEGYMVSVIKDAIKYDITHTPHQIDFIEEAQLELELA